MSAHTLERAFASTGSVLANVSPAQMDTQSPCASWKVRDLVNHIVGGTIFFATIAETGDAPSRSAGDVEDFTAADFTTTFAQGAQRAVAAFAADGAMEKPMRPPFGEVPGSLYMLIAATDTFVHGWDLAKATGQSTDLSADLAIELLANARMALPESFRGPDGQAPFGPIVEVPGTASAADQLAGFMGRHP